MAKLIIEIDDLLLSQALSKSQNKQISLDDFIDDALRAILPEINPPTEITKIIDDLLLKAVERANNKNSGEKFTLRSLFKEAEWQTLSTTPNKHALGRLFKKNPKRQEIAVLLEERQGNITVYEKLP